MPDDLQLNDPSRVMAPTSTSAEASAS